jgi:hypothetical protein
MAGAEPTGRARLFRDPRRSLIHAAPAAQTLLLPRPGWAPAHPPPPLPAGAPPHRLAAPPPPTANCAVEDTVRPPPLRVGHRFHSTPFLSRLAASNRRFLEPPLLAPCDRLALAWFVERVTPHSEILRSPVGTAQVASWSPATPASVFRESGSSGVLRTSACLERRLGLRQRLRRNGGRLEGCARRGGARRSRSSERGSVNGRHLLRDKRTPSFAHLPSGSSFFWSGRRGSIPRRPDVLHPAARVIAAARSSSRSR